jgi:lipopolysaccharide transport system ATP-binding protein
VGGGPAGGYCSKDVVLAQNISKRFELYRHPADRLRQLLPFRRAGQAGEFWALQGVNLQAEKGETVGIIGPNGCGKSTLLQIVCGILRPTTGRVVTQGRIAALLELGAGFNPEFTGRENVFLNGEILGLSRREVQRVLPAIEEFAGIGRFFDRPVKEYSSGMYVRLAFSTAIHVDPEVLVVDEALAVGDAAFANRCVRKFQELRERRVTVLFVSHDLGLVKLLSHRALLLLGGRVAEEGSPRDVVNRYIGLVLEKERQMEPARPAELAGSHQHGDGVSRLEAVELLGEAGQPVRALRSGEVCVIRIRARFHRPAASPMIGILIRNRIGMEVYGTNTRIEQIELGDFGPGDAIRIEFRFRCWLTAHEYTLTAAVQHPDGSSQDWIDDAVTFQVLDHRALAGVVNLCPEISWERQ